MVIVFDRIRENVPIMRRSTYREIVNTSVHETLTRSIITSLTTLIPLTVLYFFGGDTLKDFAFALLVGHPVRRPVVDRHRGAAGGALEGARAREQAARPSRPSAARAAIASDSDVVDLETLARAEAALDAELRAEDGGPPTTRTRTSTSEYEDEEEPRAARGRRGGAGGRRARARAEPEVEAERGAGGRRRAEAEPEPEPDAEPVPAPTAPTAPTAGDGDAQAVEPAGGEGAPAAGAPGASGPEPRSDGTVTSRRGGRR